MTATDETVLLGLLLLYVIHVRIEALNMTSSMWFQF